MENERIKLETRIHKVKDNCRGWAKMAAKATNKVKELKNLVKELKADVVKKETYLEHLQKRNDELSTLLEKAKQDAVKEFKAVRF